MTSYKTLPPLLIALLLLFSYSCSPSVQVTEEEPAYSKSDDEPIDRTFTYAEKPFTIYKSAEVPASYLTFLFSEGIIEI